MAYEAPKPFPALDSTEHSKLRLRGTWAWSKAACAPAIRVDDLRLPPEALLRRGRSVAMTSSIARGQRSRAAGRGRDQRQGRRQRFCCGVQPGSRAQLRRRSSRPSSSVRGLLRARCRVCSATRRRQAGSTSIWATSAKPILPGSASRPEAQTPTASTLGVGRQARCRSAGPMAAPAREVSARASARVFSPLMANAFSVGTAAALMSDAIDARRRPALARDAPGAVVGRRWLGMGDVADHVRERLRQADGLRPQARYPRLDAGGRGQAPHGGQHQRGCPPVVCRGTGIAWLLAGTRHATLGARAGERQRLDVRGQAGRRRADLHRQRKPLEEGTSGSPRCLRWSRGNPAEGRSPRHTSLRRFRTGYIGRAATWRCPKPSPISCSAERPLGSRSPDRSSWTSWSSSALESSGPFTVPTTPRSTAISEREMLSQTVDSEARSSAYGHLLRAAAANPAGPDQRPAMRGQEDVRHRRRWPDV